MKYEDSTVPSGTVQMHAQRIVFGRRSQPKIHSPMKVDSSASSTSIVSCAPKTSPTNRDYEVQLISNWGSCTIPVTTPRAMLMSKRFSQNFVAWSQLSLSPC